MQKNLNDISSWTKDNLMKLNEDKSNFIIFSRSQTDFTTRLSMNDKTLDRLTEIKLLGMW